MPLTLNSEYFIAPSEGEQKYPALQASNYKPDDEESEVFLCLNEKSADKLTDESKALLGLVEETVRFKQGKDSVYKISNPFQVVFLGHPSLSCYDKENKVYSRLEKGMKLAGTKKVTATRMLMAIVCNGKLLTKADGTIEAFTLKLLSTRTNMASQLIEIHNSLKKKFNAKNNRIIHLFGFSLVATPVEMKSTVVKGEASWATVFSINTDPQPLPDEMQMALCQFASSEEVSQFMKDPFYLQQQKEKASAQEVSDRKSVLDSILAAATTIGFVDADDRKNFLQSFVQDRFGKNNSSELTFDELNIMSDELCERAMAGVTTGIEF